MLGVLFFIPQWFYTLVLMYVFWITVPQVYSSYIANQDYDLIATLPTTKRDVVLSKTLALIFLELLQLVAVLIFMIIHNRLYGSWNLGLDPNISFFGVAFVVYGIFNISFFPYYFKTAYFFGKATILGTITTLIFSAIIEYGVIRFEFMRDIFEGTTSSQWLVLVIGFIIGVILSVLSIHISIKRYAQIDR